MIRTKRFNAPTFQRLLMKLQKITETDTTLYETFLRECAFEKSEVHIGPTDSIDADNIQAYIQSCAASERGEDTKPGRVPQTTYLLIQDGKCVGLLKLRHRLNNHLRKMGGHIGYYIHPAYRQQGLGTSMLALALGEAKKLGLKEVLLTCDDDNIGSYRVMEKNGGRWTDLVEDHWREKMMRHYWIVIR